MHMRDIGKSVQAGEWWLAAGAKRGTTPLLLCVGHAGSGVAAFRPLADRLGGWEVRAVCPPGREQRLGEEPWDDLAELLRHVTEPARRLAVGRPYVVLGSCSGSVIATALAAALASELPPLALIALSCAAPHLRREVDVDGARILDRIRRNGQTPPDLIEDEEFQDLVVATYRADALLARGREIRVPGAVPIVVLIGSRDDLGPDEVDPWQEVTAGPVEVHRVDGGHFLLSENLETVAAAVSRWHAGP
jgi:surfactin synthase thioesterase subunit